ncbi:alcohol dehydrogenase catalytic domain-containing protein [Streptomyces sp. NBC_01754]|uniref:zinc-dependent alcohol dehydrogenase n=1 Tax=Streptomyces sp. NBC_01754 TaxID=2975930 RepID=UPI002DDB26C9|nr:alcohol dehydrogenase catalytic domain-containing protein [Streptomyces sp. NBC_01754]WSC96388.1 alcohol dehydrogenase catalytic domain-containing protein [Streptomyces sp. NBC_01754]
MKLPDSTLAAVTTGRRTTELRTLPVPAVGEDDALLRVEAAGVCGSDVVAYDTGGLPERIMGHENVGTIVAVGAGAARRWGVAEGDRVAVEEYLPCGHCRFCRTSEFRLCLGSDPSHDPTALRYGTTSLATGSGLWGGFSQYLGLHERSVLHRVPDGVPSELAAMALPIANGYEWAYREGGAGPGKTVVVLGPGQQGLGCVLASHVAGAPVVIAVGLRRDAHRLEVARRLGATHTVCAEDVDLVDEVSRITGGALADVVVDTAAGSSRTVNQAITLTRKRGTVVIAVSSREPLDGVRFGQISRKYLTVRGVRGHSYEAVESALGLMAAERYAIADMSSMTVGLDGVHDAVLGTAGELDTPVIHATVLPWSDHGGEF